VHKKTEEAEEEEEVITEAEGEDNFDERII